MRILFSPFMLHLEGLFDVLCTPHKVTVLAFTRNSKVSRMYNYKKVSPLHTRIIPPDLTNLMSRVGISTQLPQFISSFSKNISKNTITHIVCFDFYHWYSIQAIQYKKKHPEVKLVIYSETKRWPQNRLSRFVMWWFLAYVQRNISYIDGVLVYTEEGREWWAKEVPAARVAVLPAPVETSTFMPTSTREWLPSDTLRILMNARYSPYKRHDDLFKAIRELKAQGRQVSVTLIGRDDGGRARVAALADAVGVSEEVRFLDALPMSEMPALYHEHDVLVLPSYNEAIGMVVPEAMACGLPTITSDTVGANVYVKEGETGYIFETGKVNQLVEKLDACFDTVTLKRMGIAGRQRIESHFTPKQIAEQFLDFIK
jgi:glycosyltransferase involved in cell wall biosynthesis